MTKLTGDLPDKHCFFLHNLEKQAGFINFEGSRHLPYVNRDDTLLSITHSSYSTMLLHCYTTPLCHIMYYSLLSFNPLSPTLIIRLLGRSFSLAWIFLCKYLKIILILSYMCKLEDIRIFNKKLLNLPCISLHKRKVRKEQNFISQWFFVGFDTKTDFNVFSHCIF